VEKAMMDRSELQGSIPVRRTQITAAVLVFLLVPLVVAAQGTTSTKFRLIHTFSGGKDGATPFAGLIIDQSGNLYGTAFLGGRGTCPPQNIGCGTVFELSPSGSGWVFKTVYAFLGNNDGAGPYAAVAFGPGGSLYGTTNQGGSQACPSGCGVVFKLKPPATACPTESCAWTESVLHRFQGGDDGFYPFSVVTVDKAGNLYGTTEQSDGAGTVWELTRSNGAWKNTVLYDFPGSGPGLPFSGVIFDHAGNLYGTVAAGGATDAGGIYQLSRSDPGWTEKFIYNFQADKDGDGPTALFLGKSGDLIGATSGGGLKGGGTAYSLSFSTNHWTQTTLYDFKGPGYGPWAQLTTDAAGNFYGTTWGATEGYCGTVFKLTHSSSGWKETVLHRFSGGSDGCLPYSDIVFDGHGNLYGTTSQGGAYNDGVVFEITP